jgi:Spy/CpxP family protein refolding chaperone
MTKKKMILGVLLMISLTALVLVFAQEPRGPGGRGRGEGMRGFCEDLNLTTEQQTKMIDLKFVHEQEVLVLKKDMMKKRMELKAELDKENPSVTVLDKLTDDMSALQGKMKKSKLHFLLSLKTVLTKEQWLQAKERFDERGEGGPDMRPQMHQGKAGCMGPGKGMNTPPSPPPMPDEDEDQ